MSRVQPPSVAPGLSLRTPLAAKTRGGGQVLSAGAMKSSILNGPFVKWLSNGVATGGDPVRIVPLQTFESGGTFRFTSSCGIHVYAVPATSFCVARAA